MIWLAGAAGLLGSEVLAALQTANVPHVATRRDVDVCDEAAVFAYAAHHRPTHIVNCTGYTAVDRAESDETAAFAVNVSGARHLARAARDLDAVVVHVSTDYVFDGESDAPYDEAASARPLNAYGRTKLAGEVAVRETCSRHAIVRTSWLHGPGGSNFVGTVLRLLAERSDLQVVDDQVGRPTYAADLAQVVLALCEAEGREFGVLHYANAGVCSWYEFALEIERQARILGLVGDGASIVPIPSTSRVAAAVRPKRAVLAIGRIEALLGRAAPTWQDGLSRHLARRPPRRT